jgi:hypothetical protein
MLFADTETGKNPAQQIIRAERTRDFGKGLLSLAQVFCQ